MDGFRGANDRSCMCFQPFHSDNEVDIGRLQNSGRNMVFQTFNFNGNVVSNQGGWTLARGMQLGISQSDDDSSR